MSFTASPEESFYSKTEFFSGKRGWKVRLIEKVIETGVYMIQINKPTEALGLRKDQICAL